MGDARDGTIQWFRVARSSRSPFSASRRKLLEAVDVLPSAAPHAEEAVWRDARQSDRDSRAPRGQNSLSHPLLIAPESIHGKLKLFAWWVGQPYSV